jgi:predicted metal-binding transcription factor (methanogenesis marker protein 9)
MWFRIEDHHVKAKKEVAKRRKLASGQQVCN